MEIFTIVTAFGLGSILTVIVQYYVSNRSAVKHRKYDERKEAYIGLLEAWVRQESADFSQATMKDVGHWILRSQLVASEGVYTLLSDWMEAEPGSKVRIDVTNRLKSAMRDDLRSL